MMCFNGFSTKIIVFIQGNSLWCQSISLQMQETPTSFQWIYKKNFLDRGVNRSLIITIDKDNRFLYRCLVSELRLKELSGKESSLLSALVPSYMKVVNINLPQVTHHFHLIVLFIEVFIKILREREAIGYFQASISN
jgi:hypothetical protein